MASQKGPGDGSVWETGTGSEFPHRSAFTALKADGSVLTWGNNTSLGDVPLEPQGDLSNGVKEVFSTLHAFAALKDDGSVVTWGDMFYGGDSGALSRELSDGVKKIFSTAEAFAALKDDGSIVTWGNDVSGGNSVAVSGELSGGVKEIFSTVTAFAALKDDGSVVTWGNGSQGGESSHLSDLSGEVEDIFSTVGAFAALKADGSVVTWGDFLNGGFSSAVSADLSGGVTNVFSTRSAFAALKDDGSVVTWGRGSQGGDSSAVSVDLSSGVTDIFSTKESFAALKADDSVVAWGHRFGGGDSSHVSDDLSDGVEEVFSTERAFAALKADGSVVTWGNVVYGGNSVAVSGDLSGGVTEVFSTANAFAALKDDGSVVTWGDDILGGDSSAVTGELSGGVTEVFSSRSAFAALKDDGSVVTWGDPDSGGDSSAVADQLSSGVVTLASPFDAQDPSGGTDDGDNTVDPGPGEDDPAYAGDVAYQVTADPYPVNQDYEAIIDDRFGDAADLADWETVSARYADEGGAFLRAAGLVPIGEDGITTGAVTRDGDSFWSGDRQYYVAWGDVHSGFLSHDIVEYEGVPLHLGSWYSDRYILAKGPAELFDGMDDPADPSDPDVETGTPSPVDASPLLVSAPNGWDDDGNGGVVNAGTGPVYLGHAEGEAALLRVEDGSVAISADGRVSVDGTVHAVGDATGRALFTGSFTIEPGALDATEFTPQSGGYGLLADLVAINFTQLSFSEGAVALGADLDFPTALDALDTSGGPLALRFGAEGLTFGPGRIGTSDWLPDFDLPLSAGAPVELSFSNLGVDYDALEESLYLSGEATLGWGGDLADQFDTLGVPAQALTLDLAGERTGDALFERGDKYVRLRSDEGTLTYDIVGDISYSSEAGFLRELTLGLNTIEQSFNGSVTGAFGFVSERTVTGELTGFWDPVAIDSVSFAVDGLNLPVAATGLFLQGGSLGVAGLAGPQEAVASVRTGEIGITQTGVILRDGKFVPVDTGPTYSGTVEYTYGSAAGGLPTPFRGDISGSFRDGSVEAGFSIRSTPGFILGDAASGGITDVMQDYFGVDPDAVLDFDILTASGQINANFANNSLTMGLDATLLGGFFNGRADLAMFENAGIRMVDFGATGRLEFPEDWDWIGGVGADGNIKLEFSADDDLSNDYVAAWTKVDLGLWERDAGFRVTFDGNFDFLNGDEIELIGSWELGPEMEIAVMTAEWDIARAGAELVVITPDGTRLSEADIAARDDIAIAPGLTSDTSRAVAVETPEAGIWDIEMVAPVGLGEVTYSANTFRSGPTVEFVVSADDRHMEVVDLTLTAQGLSVGSELIVNALANRDDGSGVRLDVGELQSQDGTQTITWDYSSFDPGIYHLEAVARGGGVTPETAIAETTITVDAEISGSITGVGGIALSETTLRFYVEDEEIGADVTDVAGGFTLRAPPDTSGELALERNVTEDDIAGIGASDALDALRLAVGLDPAWGPADAADFVAADFNGDGSVSAVDALDILRTAVGLDTGTTTPRWVFGDMDGDGVDANNVPALDNRIDIAALTADTQINAQGILVGNMQDYV